jgi:hypothetical protein
MGIFCRSKKNNLSDFYLIKIIQEYGLSKPLKFNRYACLGRLEKSRVFTDLSDVKRAFLKQFLIFSPVRLYRSRLRNVFSDRLKIKSN